MIELVSIGVMLIFVGFFLIFISLLAGGERKGEVKGGGVIMIGPVPVVFGSDAKWASVAIVLAIVLVLLTFLLYVV